MHYLLNKTQGTEKVQLVRTACCKQTEQVSFPLSFIDLCFVIYFCSVMWTLSLYGLLIHIK